MSEPFEYDPADFGADGISVTSDWRGSGYTHYTAWSRTGGQISWNEIEEANAPREVVDIHLSDMNLPD